METLTRCPRPGAHIPGYFWLKLDWVTGQIPRRCNPSPAQMFRFKFSLPILVPSHCVLANGEFLVWWNHQTKVHQHSWHGFGQLDLLKSGFSRSLILMPPSHFHIWNLRKTKTPSKCLYGLHFDLHTSSTPSPMLIHLPACASLSQWDGNISLRWPMWGQ